MVETSNLHRSFLSALDDGSSTEAMRVDSHLSPPTGTDKLTARGRDGVQGSFLW